MVNYSVVFHGPLMLGNAVSGGSGGSGISPLQRFQARIFVEERSVEGVISEPLEGMFIHWASDLEHLLVEDSLCTVHGRLIVRASGQNLQWEVNSYMCFPFPGNPDDDQYMNRLPPPQPGALHAIGLCTRSTVPSDPNETCLRSFELRTTVYDRSNTDNHSTSFCVRCYLPAGPRFQATPIPERNALVAVAGEIIGVHEESGVIAILLHELIFLSARGQKRPAGDDPNITSSGLGSTPRKRRAWDAWGSRSGQKVKRQALVPSSPTPAGSSQDPLHVEDGE
ncbi:hypothetical protein FN846DRAFT_895656 [Sphaerosporella brunnea]|uniref:Uncharacterized protein n=1 Tax=Sphaerosporella brunnea TaxID=1250544 RepID=A0A5J5EGA6_9PEZI|nr:hypothetical protein FN846DRAFT_895656 [Sphaerosporella brunnea]